MFSQRNRKVLVADNNEADRKLIQAILISAGYDVHIYPRKRQKGDCEEIVALFQQWQPEILLLESRFDTLDARELVNKLKSNPDFKRIPIVMLAELVEGEPYPSGIEWGADGFVTKPFDFSQLLMSIENLLQIKQCNDCLQHQQAQIGRLDHLTSLPNRFSFQETLKVQCNGRAANTHFYLVIIDIDNFKRVNDALGHSVGDVLIQYLALRISGSINKHESISYLGAGSFALIFDCDEATLRLNLKALNALLIEPFIVSGNDICLTCSQGVAKFPDDGDDWETLLKHAEIALYEAKNQGRDTHRFFNPAMDAKLMRQFRLRGDIRNAIERNDFYLLYQPQVGAPEGKIIGMEALIRWNHPELGELSPMEFIPLAEDSELICEIGDWVIQTACAMNKQWQDQGILNAVVAVNVSARQFKNGSILASVEKALHNSGLAPGFLELELTESLLMVQPDVSATTLKKLSNLGVKVSIDDFGTGYSSLSYLKHFPIDQIKIDQGFVGNITTSSDDSAIALTIIAMAHQLKREVIAEGVETEAQFRYLHRHHCYKYQGYYFSKPLPVSAIKEGFVDYYPGVKDFHAQTHGEQTVLLVDDEPGIVQSLKRLFRRTPYRLLAASNVDDCFEILACESVDIVLCDQQLAARNGTELLKQIKNLYPEVLSILLSTFSDVGTVIDSVNEGSIFKFLLKPWNDDELLISLKEAFHYRKLEQENRLLKQTLNDQ